MWRVWRPGTGSAQRLLEDSRKTQEKAEAGKGRARGCRPVGGSTRPPRGFRRAARKAGRGQAAPRREAEAALLAEPRRPAPKRRPARRMRARERSEAEGEMNALRAEAGALAKLVERDTAEGGSDPGPLAGQQGFEKALGRGTCR